MGYDLTGRKKDYIRHRENESSWMWIWDIVCNNCDFLTPKDKEEGWVNNGYFITKEKAKMIADKLTKLLKENKINMPDIKKIRGKTMMGYINKVGALKDSGVISGLEMQLKSFSDEMPNEMKIGLMLWPFINFCEESGGFEIW